MSGVVRRFTSFPDVATLRRLPGVVIVDAPPQGAAQGADSGTVGFVAETEDGGFAIDPIKPTDVFHMPGGLQQVFENKWDANGLGAFGFTVNGLKYKYPCAVRSGGEYWNGNGYVQIKSLAFRALFVARVDTSIGTVTLSPLAFIESGNVAPFALDNGQTIIGQAQDAVSHTATITAAAAVVTGSGGSLTTVTAGEYVDLAFDGNATVRTTFTSADVDETHIIARINAAFGTSVASDDGSGDLRLTSSINGTASQIKVIGGSTGTLTKLGLTIATTNGTGNVANVAAVTAAEIATIWNAAATSCTTRLPDSGRVRFASKLGGTGTIALTAGTALAGLGITASATPTAASSGTLATTIPAGTVCSHGGTPNTKQVVTMQTLSIPPSTSASITVRVRPAIDDGTYAGASASQIDTLETIPSRTSEWVVNNPSSLSVALTEAQKDAAYAAAVAVTKALSGPAKKLNYIVCARQSHQNRAVTIRNAIDSSGQGAFGRKALVSPPIGTSIALMTGTAAPGIAAYRSGPATDERFAYIPGWKKFIGEINEIGITRGDPGFTPDGIIETHGDIVAASVCSILNPEENPAQATDLIDPGVYVGVETALETWGPDEYATAQQNGIMAPYHDEDEGMQFMSGVTAVDPTIDSTRVPMARIKLADFLTDTVAGFQKKAVKKLATETRRALLLGDLGSFLQAMKDAERIGDFTFTEKAPPARRMELLEWAVDPLDSIDQLVNQTRIGEGALGLSTTRTA